MKNILLISKDVLRPDYLGCYGGILYETRNIDKLAENGTLFTNFYTSAPSSAMALTSMFAGVYPYETERAKYDREVREFTQCPTLSHILEQRGYEIHAIWGTKWHKTAWKQSRVFCSSTHFHNLHDIWHQIGSHYLRNNREKKEKFENANPVDEIYSEVKKIFKNLMRKNLFIWIHVPHVFAGRNGYGADIDLFDSLVGMLFDFFQHDEIYLTADHGHMNCEKGIPVYGHHVYEGAVKIPLITPNHFGKKVIEDVIDNTQLKNIILNHKYKKQEFIFSDTQYYLQENRKIMIRKGDFKYIYNKSNKSEELYDLKYDPCEYVNLLIDNWYDWNRGENYYLEEIYYYPRWEEARKAYSELKLEKNRIWKQGSFIKELLFNLNRIRKKGLANLYPFFIKKDRVRGRWSSVASRLYYRK